MTRTTHILALLLAGAGAAHAVTADEAKALGTTLTAVGAEKAGNKEGTIPAYTGGLTTPPAAFKAGDGIRPNPFAGDKVRLQIDAKNMAANAGMLTRAVGAYAGRLSWNERGLVAAVWSTQSRAARRWYQPGRSGTGQ